MPATVVTPQCGFARNKSEAEYPHLWPTGGAWSPCLSPPGGVVLRDLSGRANHGTLTNMEASSDWVRNSGYCALDYDGTNEYVDVGDVIITDGLTNFAYSLWLQTDSVSGFHGLMGKWASGVGPIMFLNGAAVAWQVGSGRVTTGTLVVGQWHHILADNLAGTLRVYLDGALQAGTAAADLNTDNAATLKIGLNSDGGVGYMDGRIAEACIYTQSLAAGIVNQLHKLGPGGWATPRRRRVYAPAAEPGFKPYWASQRSRILTGGIR